MCAARDRPRRGCITSRNKRRRENFSPPLKEPRMRRVQPEADRAVTEAGIDLIDGDRHLFASCQFSRGEGREKIALAIFEHSHLAKLDMDGDDCARLAASPEAQPEGAVQAQKEGGVLGCEAGHAARPASTGDEGDGEAEAGGNATVAAQPGGRLLDQPAADMVGPQRVAKLR